jgi:hypothetical protein
LIDFDTIGDNRYAPSPSENVSRWNYRQALPKRRPDSFRQVA